LVSSYLNQRAALMPWLNLNTKWEDIESDEMMWFLNQQIELKTKGTKIDLEGG
jgi:hypothetical protein